MILGLLQVAEVALPVAREFGRSDNSFYLFAPLGRLITAKMLNNIEKVGK